MSRDRADRRPRRDEELPALDLPGAITQGVLLPGSARSVMFTEAAIAASWRAQELGIGPYPLRYLAACVRSMGLRAALELPEPLIGAGPTELVRGWMTAAVGWPDRIEDDDLFARWLEMVATLLAARRSLRAQDRQV